MPHALTVTEIHDITIDFKNAARNSMDAGFDGVEIHSENGYLFHQFFTNCSNTRSDEYGRTHENKARFFFETLDAVGDAIGFEKVGVRLNPSMHSFFGITLDEDTIPTFEYIVTRLNNYENLAYLHLIEPMVPVDSVPYAMKAIAKHFRPLYKGKLVINCGFNRSSGNQIIEEEYADAVAFGKPFISNPDLVERIRRGVEWANWDEKTFYTRGPRGYTDYLPLDEEGIDFNYSSHKERWH
jgi:N-ethylmaleimide reductase